MIGKLVEWAKGKAAPVTGRSGFGAGWVFGLPGTRRDYRSKAGPYHLNTVCAIGIQQLGTMVTGASLHIERLAANGVDSTVIRDHPLARLAITPNSYMSWSTLVHALCTSLMIDGNAYALIWPNALGEPAAIYYLPHHLVKPRSDGPDQDGSKGVTHYEYSQPGGTTINFAPEYILHARQGVDPDNPLRGMSAMRAAAMEVFTDNAARVYNASVLENGGFPGLLITLDGDMKMDGKDAETLAASLRERFRGDGTGRTAFVPAALKMQQPGFSPKDLELGSMSLEVMHRLCAAMGFDPMALNLPSQSKTYANQAEARRAAWTMTVGPMLESLAGDITSQILHRWMQEPTDVIARFDVSRIPVVLAEQKEKVAMAAVAFNAGFADMADARRMADLPVDPSHVGQFKTAPVPQVTPGAKTRAFLARQGTADVREA